MAHSPCVRQLFLLLFSRGMELYRMLTVFSLQRNILEVLVSPPTPPLSSNADPFGRGAARPTPTLFSSTVFLPLQQQRKPSLLSTSQLFLICCSHPRHYCLSYQPDRTRIHILQAFMMAAAHLCKPVCLPGLPSDRLAPWALDRAAAWPNVSFLFSTFFSFLSL